MKIRLPVVTKWGEDFFFFSFQNDLNLFWVNQYGNFLPVMSISRREKKNLEKLMCPLRKLFLLRPCILDSESGVFFFFLVLPWPWNRTSPMAFTLQHFNYKTLAGFPNTLAVMPLNIFFLLLLFLKPLVLTTTMLFFTDYRLINFIASRKFKILLLAPSNFLGNPVSLASCHSRIFFFFKLLIIVYKCTNNVIPFYLS